MTEGEEKELEKKLEAFHKQTENHPYIRFNHQVLEYTVGDFISEHAFKDAVKAAATKDEFQLCLLLLELKARDLQIDSEDLDEKFTRYSENYDALKKSLTEPVSQSDNPSTGKSETPDDASGIQDVEMDPHTSQIQLKYNGKPLILKTGHYLVSLTDGVVEAAAGRSGKRRICTRCLHPIFPVELLQNIETGKESLRIAFFNDGTWKDIVRIKSELYNPSIFRTYVDYGINIEPGQSSQLISYLQRLEHWNRDVLPRKMTCSHLGWAGTDGMAFLPYTPDIMYEEARKYPEEYNSLLPTGSFDLWRDAVAKYRDEDHKLVRIILAVSFASVLVRPMGCLPFILHIWSSESSIGKTVATMLCASVWAKPGQHDGYWKSFNSTDESLTQAAQFLCDLPLLIDERQTAVRSADFEHLIYTLCEGKPRGRFRSSGGNNSRGSWSNTIVTTGEQPLISVKSRSGANARVVELSPTKPLFSPESEEMNEFCTILNKNNATAGRRFISKLQGTDIPEELSDDDLNFSECSTGMDAAKAIFHFFLRKINRDINSKQAMSAALILTADALISTSWIFNDHIRLTVEDIRPFLKTETSVSFNKNVYDQLTKWLDTHETAFTSADESSRYGLIVSHNGKTTYAFKPRMLQPLIEEIGGDLTQFIDWAIDAGFAAVDNDGVHKTISVKDSDGKAKRYYGIYFH